MIWRSVLTAALVALPACAGEAAAADAEKPVAGPEAGESNGSAPFQWMLGKPGALPDDAFPPEDGKEPSGDADGAGHEPAAADEAAKAPREPAASEAPAVAGEPVVDASNDGAETQPEETPASTGAAEAKRLRSEATDQSRRSEKPMGPAGGGAPSAAMPSAAWPAGGWGSPWPGFGGGFPQTPAGGIAAPEAEAGEGMPRTGDERAGAADYDRPPSGGGAYGPGPRLGDDRRGPGYGSSDQPMAGRQPWPDRPDESAPYGRPPYPLSRSRDDWQRRGGAGQWGGPGGNAPYGASPYGGTPYGNAYGGSRGAPSYGGGPFYGGAPYGGGSGTPAPPGYGGQPGYGMYPGGPGSAWGGAPWQGQYPWETRR